MDRKSLEEKGLNKEAIDFVLNSYHEAIDKYKKELEDTKLELKDKSTKEFEFDKLNEQLEAYKLQVTKYKNDLEEANTQNQKKIQDMQIDFEIERQINKNKGKSIKAIRAYLDLEKISKSQDYAKEIETSLKTLVDNDETSFLFNSEQNTKIGSIGGTISKTAQTPNYLDEYYKNNPFYKRKKW